MTGHRDSNDNGHAGDSAAAGTVEPVNSPVPCLDKTVAALAELRRLLRELADRRAGQTAIGRK